MKTRKIFSGVVIFAFVSVLMVEKTNGQEPALDIPVELIGFPVIILAVRLSNFAKKLAYSLNPRTYASRSKRAVMRDDMIDMVEVEKRLIAELGENVCIYTRVCLYHAEKASKTSPKPKIINWNDVFRDSLTDEFLKRRSHLCATGSQTKIQYKLSKEKDKEYYLLSVFLGDIVASPKFCNQLAKRGRACQD